MWARCSRLAGGKLADSPGGGNRNMLNCIFRAADNELVNGRRNGGCPFSFEDEGAGGWWFVCMRLEEGGSVHASGKSSRLHGEPSRVVS